MRLNRDDKRLTGRQLGEFSAAILDAYTTLPPFDRALSYQLGIPRQRIALGEDMQEIVDKVIRTAEDESWTAELLQAMRVYRATHLLLLRFAQSFGLAPATPPAEGKALERKIRDAGSLMDVEPWMQRLGEIMARVCRVEIGAGWPQTFGTGFLLGPDLVMTNYHVMADVIEKRAPPGQTAFRFDYRRLADGAEVNPGVLYRLADDWLVDCSPFSAVDMLSDPGDRVPDQHELDYALLHLDREAGNDPVSGGKQEDPQAPVRGSIPVPAEVHTFAPQSSLFILQHPGGQPLQLALDTHSVLGMNGNGTRVRYTTTTEPGSSGSPCFDGYWNLVALHHMGDPNFDPKHKPAWNQGIPFWAILDRLEQNGKADELHRT